MALKVKSAAEAGEKLGRRAPGAVPDYVKGIKSPKRPWQESTLAAEDIYDGAVTAAIADKRFGKGVRGSSNAEHQAMSIGKGAARYPSGIREAIPKYVRKMGPVLTHMAAITLPPPGPRGSPANIARSSHFQAEMAKFRTEG